MPSTITTALGNVNPDTVYDGAELDFSPITGYRIRTFKVTDIPISSAEPYSDPLVLENATGAVQSAGMTYGSAYSTTLAEYRLTRYVCRPIANTGGGFASCKVSCYYTIPDFGTSAYVIRDRTTTMQRYTDIIPGNRQIIRQNYTIGSVNPDGTDTAYSETDYADLSEGVIYDDDGDVIAYNLPTDTLKLNLTFPAKQLSIYVYNFGGRVPPLPGATYVAGSYVSYVNSTTWQGLPPGYWRLDGYNTEVSRYIDAYSVEAIATTKVVEDWSEFGIMTDKKTGRAVVVSNSKMATAIGLPYNYGYIWPASPDPTVAPIPDGSGFVRIGPHMGVDFSLLFGF